MASLDDGATSARFGSTLMAMPDHALTAIGTALSDARRPAALIRTASTCKRLHKLLRELLLVLEMKVELSKPVEAINFPRNHRSFRHFKMGERYLVAGRVIEITSIASNDEGDTIDCTWEEIPSKGRRIIVNGHGDFIGFDDVEGAREEAIVDLAGALAAKRSARCRVM